MEKAGLDYLILKGVIDCENLLRAFVNVNKQQLKDDRLKAIVFQFWFRNNFVIQQLIKLSRIGAKWRNIDLELVRISWRELKPDLSRREWEESTPILLPITPGRYSAPTTPTWNALQLLHEFLRRSNSSSTVLRQLPLGKPTRPPSQESGFHYMARLLNMWSTHCHFHVPIILRKIAPTR